MRRERKKERKPKYTATLAVNDEEGESQKLFKQLHGTKPAIRYLPKWKQSNVPLRDSYEANRCVCDGGGIHCIRNIFFFVIIIVVVVVVVVVAVVVIYSNSSIFENRRCVAAAHFAQQHITHRPSHDQCTKFKSKS